MEEYSPTDIIINFGETGEKFYIILKGSVSVLIPVKKKIKLTRNEMNHYKQIANEQKHNQSASSSSTDSNIDSIRLPEKKERRDGIAVASVSEIVKSLQNEKRIFANNKNNSNFPEDEEVAIAKLFTEKFKKEKKDIVRVVKGADNEFIEIEINKLEEVSILTNGDSFGELALLSDRPRAATIMARERVSLLIIRQYQFKRILGSISEKRLNGKIRFLRSLSYFKSWSKSALIKISMYFQPLTVTRNQCLFLEGNEAKELFFIKEGEFMITKKLQLTNLNSPKYQLSINSCNKNRKIFPKNKLMKLCIKGKNESIGGYEILNRIECRIFSSVCVSTSAEVYYILKDHFFSKIPQLENLKNEISFENSRLLDRFKELSLAEEQKESDEKGANKALTPQPEKSSLKMKSLKFLLEYNPKIHSINSRSTPSPTKEKTFYRELTQNEINRAVNGRTLKIYKKEKKILYIRKRSPPPSFMHKSPRLNN